jgi:hypothetical protein
MRTEEPLSILFVARTRQPYDALKVREALNARGLPGGAKDRTLYQITLPGGNVSALLWCADEHTLLIALARQSLEKAVLPRDGSPDPLVPEVRAVLKERIPPGTQLWVAGHCADWSKNAGVVLLSRLPADWQNQLVTIRTFGIGTVLADKAVTLNAAARCDDAKAAERFDKWLVGKAGDKHPPTIAREDNWLSLQLRTDTDALPGLLAP